jgi:hypothetical protein
VSHIRRKQVGVEDNRGRSDQIVDRTDAAMAFSIPTSQLSSYAGDIVGNLRPVQD